MEIHFRANYLIYKLGKWHLMLPAPTNLEYALVVFVFPVRRKGNSVCISPAGSKQVTHFDSNHSKCFVKPYTKFCDLAWLIFGLILYAKPSPAYPAHLLGP